MGDIKQDARSLHSSYGGTHLLGWWSLDWTSQSAALPQALKEI